MASITTRAGKGSPLTNAEVDANFTNLNAELLTKQDALGFTPANKAGDTFTGNVLVNSGADSRVLLQSGGTTQGQVQATGSAVRLASNNALPLYLSQNGVDLLDVTTTAIVGNRHFRVPNSASHNYGFVGEQSAGTGKWNLFMSGTASNYLAGATIFNNAIGLGSVSSPSYGTVGQVLTSAGAGAAPTWTTLTGALSFTGDVTGTGSTGSSTSLTLANSGVTAGVYGANAVIPSITVDAKGRVTNAAGVTPSGTWGISITGSAGSISGYNNPTTAATANTIAYRDANGDIAAREIVLSSSVSSATPTTLVSMYPSSNQLVRTTPAAVSAAIQGAASGTWGISITGNAATVTNGLTTTNYTSTLDSRYKEDNAYVDFTVDGDANTYYPVLLSGAKQYAWGSYSVTRGYNWTAPNTWYTSTHRGGLTLGFRWSGDTGWGGNDKTIVVEEFNESYSTMVGGMVLTTSGLIVFLRGGTANYRYYSPAGDTASATVYLSGYTASNGTVYASRANNSGNSEVYSRFPVRGATVWSDGYQTLSTSNYSSYALPLSGGTLTGLLASGRNDVERVFESRNTSAGSPAQFFIEHSYGNVNIGNLRGNLNVSSGALQQGGNQVLHAGNYTSYSPIPAGTVMLFAQTAAPTGWTKSTTHDNKALRVVSGTASSGGSVAFTTAFASQSVSGTVSATTLDTSQIPAHRHFVIRSNYTNQGAQYSITVNSGNYVAGAGGGGYELYYLNGQTNDANAGNSSATGGGGSHTHGFSGGSVNLAVQYVDVIIATKN